jgi:hypothetical protein
MSDAETMRDWVSGLREFTNRNAGRRTVLEEEAPGEGLRPEQSGYPFWGASWDPRDGCVQIMLGEQGSVERHLTRSIRAAQAIDLMRGADGRDRALRITHPEGCTLLSFVAGRSRAPAPRDVRP